MNKTLIIFKREYLTRVTKKSFLILTLLMPLLMAVLMFLPAYLATRDSKTENKVAVVDRSSLFLSELQDGTSTKFTYIPEEEYQQVKDNLEESGYYALLEIPQNILTVGKVLVYSDKQVNIDVKSHIDWQIENTLEKQKRAELVNRLGIPELEEKMQNTNASISVETIKLGEDGTGKKSSTEIAMGIGYAIGFIIYLFVFMYGNMVMRGVLEEKQSRIVEVIISSVKPIQLMMGKILGIAAVGITQVLIWVVLMVGIFFGAKSFFLDDAAIQSMAEAQTSSIMATTGTNADVAAVTQTIEPSQAQQIFEQIEGINFPLIIGSFIVFFVLGYLLYSSLMAAVASAVDSEEDMQQFMLPVTMPLILAMVVLMNVIKNPEGSLAFWASHIPFTSPIIMMVRIPFGVAWWEILISMAILAVSTYGCVWMAARIYRTGILMYGKKPTWKELGKWLTFKS